jgi:hypothetical protein
MNNLIPITRHEKYMPTKVRADLFYGIDCNLDENTRALYHLLLAVSSVNYGITYISWPTTEDAISELLKTEWARNLQTYAVKNAFSSLRKNRYLRHSYVKVLDARVLELLEFIGVNARS